MREHVEQEPSYDNDEVPADHNDGKPGRYPSMYCEKDESRHQKELVGKGVQECAEWRLLVSHPRHKAVQHICERGTHKKIKGLPVSAVNDCGYKHRNNNYPQYG